MKEDWPIRTKRLVLFPLERSEILGLMKGSRGCVRGMHLHPHWPGQDLLEALPVAANDMLEDTSSTGWNVWAVADIDRSIIIGDAGFKGAPDTHGVVKIGYSIVGSERRKGYAFEALKALISWAGEQEIVISVQAQVEKGNTNSLKLLEKLGFEMFIIQNDIFVLKKVLSK